MGSPQDGGKTDVLVTDAAHADRDAVADQSGWISNGTGCGGRAQLHDAAQEIREIGQSDRCVGAAALNGPGRAEFSLVVLDDLDNDRFDEDLCAPDIQLVYDLVQ